MTGKPWYRSKTIWMNFLGAIAAVGTAFGVDLGLDQETQATIAMGILAIVNVALRLVTREPVRRGKRSGGANTAASIVLLATLALALPGCAALQEAVIPEHPPDTAEEVVGDVESRITAAYRATTRASQAGSLTLDEVVEIRERLAEASGIAEQATRLIELGRPGEAQTTVDRAEAILDVLQRRLREAQPDE